MLSQSRGDRSMSSIEESYNNVVFSPSIIQPFPDISLSTSRVLVQKILITSEFVFSSHLFQWLAYETCGRCQQKLNLSKSKSHPNGNDVQTDFLPRSLNPWTHLLWAITMNLHLQFWHSLNRTPHLRCRSSHPSADLNLPLVSHRKLLPLLAVRGRRMRNVPSLMNATRLLHWVMKKFFVSFLHSLDLNSYFFWHCWREADGPVDVWCLPTLPDSPHHHSQKRHHCVCLCMHCVSTFIS